MTQTATAPTSPESRPERPRSHWDRVATAAEHEHWDAVAAGVAEILAADVLQRDRGNLDPTTELEPLRSSGLVNLLDPAEFGGGGAVWSTAFRVIRILAAADASLAQILLYHYVNSANIAFSAPESERERFYRATIEGRWLWGDSVNPVDPDLELTPRGDGFELNGLKRFSTGVSSGDAVLVNAVIAAGDRSGETLTFVLPRDRAGIEPLGDWDFLGQRQSASGSVRFTGVRVDASEILGALVDEPFATLITPSIQLGFGNLYLGIAQGALAKGRGLTLGRKNSWFLSGVETYAQDPFVRRLYGELVAHTAAAEALADRVGALHDAEVARGAAVTAESRAAQAIDIAKVKIVTDALALDVTTRIYEATGSSSAKSSIGLDLYWRNVRTHSLHDPVDYKKLEVGANYLTGDVQPLSLYT
jgi:alkylation response protein AidB-like acyl-CoA dehydrogenase